MRHGRTNYNDLGLCNDDPARDVYLTEAGIAQAQSAALALREVAFERILVSPLPRTRQTAEIVNRYRIISQRLVMIRSGRA
nr:histidine phosphatase family protein [Nitrosomonas sp.]